MREKSDDELALETIAPMLLEFHMGGMIKFFAIEREMITIEYWPLAKKEFNGIVHVTIEGVTKYASEWLKEIREMQSSSAFLATLSQYIGPEDMPQ